MKKINDVVKFHGHICPRLALGYRVSEFALKELGKFNTKDDAFRLAKTLADEGYNTLIMPWI